MFRPDLSGDAFLRRYQNPQGHMIRATLLLLLVVGLWSHRPGLILLVLLLEAANALFCPPEDTPPEWVEQVLDMVFAFLDLPPAGLKFGLAAGFALGCAFLALGLIGHHVLTILVGLSLIVSVLFALRRIAAQ